MIRSLFAHSHTLALAVAASLALAPAGASAAPERALDVPFVPTPQNVVERMLELGQVAEDDYVIDLGSGDGRIAVTAARKHGARALGVDLNPERIQEANANAEEAGVSDRVTFLNQDLFETDLSEATVITMYLLPSVNMKLRPHLLELKPGTHVVSHAFDMQDWEPDTHEQVDGRAVYLWIIPADASGKWQIRGDDPIDLELEQIFQKLAGTATIAGKTLPVSGRVRGREVTLHFQDQTWAGQLENGAMIGEDAAWHAVRQ